MPPRLFRVDSAPTRDPFWRSMLAFYGLALLFSWCAWAPLYLSRTGLGWLPVKVPMPWVVLGTLGPAIAAAVVRQRDKEGPSLVQLLMPSGRATWATPAALLVVALTFVLGSAALLSADAPHGWNFGSFSLYGFHALTTLAAGPLFEEWGWRGFAQSRLQERIGALPAALLVGVAWALWHLPLFLIPAWSSASPLFYLLMVVALSVVIAWGFNSASGWIVTAILMHAVYNGSSRVLGGFLGSATIRSWPDPVTAIMIAFAAAAAGLAVLTRGRLGLRQAQS